MDHHIGYGKIAEDTNHWLPNAPAKDGERASRHPATKNMSTGSNTGGGAFRWIATEKVHGANMAFLTDGDQVLCAKRETILKDTPEDDLTFFRYLHVKRRYEEAARRVFQTLVSTVGLKSLKKVTIYGELFGGKYPHPAVAPALVPNPYTEELEPNTEPVQEGVYYCPHIDYMAYDIAVLCEDPSDIKIASDPSVSLPDAPPIEQQPPMDHVYLSFSLTNSVLAQSGFLTACEVPPATVGASTAKGIKEFPTMVPEKIFNLPPIAGNNAEGFVIKTDGFCRICTGSASAPKWERCVYKRKIAKFEETMKKRAINYEGTEADKRATDEFKRLMRAKDSEGVVKLLSSSILNPSLPQARNLLESAISKVGRYRSGSPEEKQVAEYVTADVVAELHRLCQSIGEMSEESSEAAVSAVDRTALTNLVHTFVHKFATTA